jgi:hypothetical protein
MKTAVVLEGEAVARIVATFLGKQGVDVETFNRGTGVIYPEGRVSVDNRLVSFDKMELLIYVDPQTPIDHDKLKETIDRMKGY